MLGSPEHPGITIHFLNAMLQPSIPVVEVEILNPLIAKDRSEDKIIVLDVLAKDQVGRRFNIEMQTRLPLSFPSRLLYYNSSNYLRQMTEGDGYEQLSPAISICLVDRRLFDPKTTDGRWYHSFRLRCDQDRQLVLTDDFEFHIFELPNYQPSSNNISSLPADEKWLYLFTRAADTEPEELSDLLGDPAFREAIGVLEMISKSPDDYQYYEDRLKFLRDEAGKLRAAKQEGREEGRNEGAIEATAATVRLLESLLGIHQTNESELVSLSLESLQAKVEELQERLRRRQS